MSSATNPGSAPCLGNGFVRVGLAALMLIYLCVCSSGGGAFIYFQF